MPQSTVHALEAVLMCGPDIAMHRQDSAAEEHGALCLARFPAHVPCPPPACSALCLLLSICILQCSPTTNVTSVCRGGGTQWTSSCEVPYY
jgi:hypothetical protein